MPTSVPVGIDGHSQQFRDHLAHPTIDRGPHLARHQGQWLIVDNAPLLENMQIASYGKAPVAGILPRHVHMTRGIKAHHVRRCFETPTPALHEGERSHPFDDGVTRSPQCWLSLQEAQDA
jgi:hypothetical protein